MDEDESESAGYIDISIKRLVRANPTAFFDLVGFAIAPAGIRFEDVAIPQAEKRGDNLCVVTDVNGAEQGVVYIEYQLTPRLSVVKEWISKWAAFSERFRVPVTLLAVYLNRGRYATFHDKYRAKVRGLETLLQFNAVRLWECAPEIRSGRYPDFIPLLSLCEDHPSEATVREQLALIEQAGVSEERKRELVSVTFIVASRDIAREVLVQIVREVFTVKTLPPIVDDMFGELLRERERQAAKLAVEDAVRLTEQRERQAAEQRERQATRTNVLRLYSRRLGVPSAEVASRLEAVTDIEALHAMIDRYEEQIESWDQLLTKA